MKKILLAISLFLNLAAFAQIPTNGLVGWYPFNSSGADASGNGNNCTVYGASLTTDRFGTSNSAYYFNGYSDYMLSSFAPLTNTPFSISAWVMDDSLSNFPIIILGSSIVNNNRLGFYGSSGSTLIAIGTAGANEIQSTNGNVTVNSWHNVIVVCNGYSTSQVVFYIDGVQYTSNTSSGTNVPLPINNTGFTIGRDTCNSSCGATFAHGKIDDIGIWNRALTQQEVSQIYNVSGGCLVYDTIPVYDTITVHNTVNDTTHFTVFDTVTTHIYDTVITAISVTDTLLINVSLTGINPPNNINTVTVYPNPAHDHMEINVGNLNSMVGYSIKITNALGQVVFNSAVTQQSFYIDLNSWTGHGVYILYILDATQTVKSIKEIVLQ